MAIRNPKKIIISRTDSIGDVALTLPLAGILRENFPGAQLIFLGNSYTKPVIECCTAIDEIWDWSELSMQSPAEQTGWLKKQNADTIIHVFPRKEIAQLAKKAGIQNRIGTSHRLFHFTTCNFRPGFTRKNSALHEAQLNTKLLSPFSIKADFGLDQLLHYASFSRIPVLPAELAPLLNDGKKHLIFHPKSQGSAREWAIENYIELAQGFDPAKVTVFFTGTEKEGALFRHLLPQQHNIVDMTGKMSLHGLIAFIANCDALVAASTGPLHLAGLTGIYAVGLFSPKKPIHAGRWQPLGNKVVILEEKNILHSPQPLSIPLRDIKKALEERL